LTLAAGISAYYYYRGELNDKITAFLGSFLAGIILVIVQFLFSWREDSQTSKFKDLKIKRILVHRDDRPFYQSLIQNSRNRVQVLGVTAERFMEHFADSSQDSRPESRVLLEALARGVKVSILVPHKDYLKEDADRMRFDRSAQIFETTKERFNDFEYSYFFHEPAHSIVVVDDECIIGPVLTGLSSRNTPAIYLSSDSPYAKKYLEYFEREWVESLGKAKS